MYSRDDNDPTYSRATTDTGPTLGLVRKAVIEGEAKMSRVISCGQSTSRPQASSHCYKSLIKTGLGFYL